jgi:hypothetical protein
MSVIDPMVIAIWSTSRSHWGGFIGYPTPDVSGQDDLSNKSGHADHREGERDSVNISHLHIAGDSRDSAIRQIKTAEASMSPQLFERTLSHTTDSC